MSDGELRDQWLDALREGSTRTSTTHRDLAASSRASYVANAVALQVLRDALLAPEDAQDALANQSSRPGSRGGTGTGTKPSHVRSNSFSKTYTLGIGRAETDLVNGSQPSRPTAVSLLMGEKRQANASSQSLHRPSNAKSTDETIAAHSQTGHDIALTVCQNSHLPAVLGLLNAHVDVAPHPLDPSGTAFRPPLQPLTRLPLPA
jgi:hypothetical protein